MAYIDTRGILSLLFSIFSIALYAQITISGSVTELNGDPLIGVSVYVEGQETAGTVTGLDGGYELRNVSPEATIVFSYIGFETQRIPVQGRAKIDVVMREGALKLQEVVVAALGVQRDKKAIGYSAQEIGGEALVQSRETNLISALSGKIAGVDIISSSGSPGASANIVIRGRTSFSGSNAPLIVVDGIPIDNSYAGSNFTDQSNRAIDINPNDVESITVLKGTAATALYGMRAGNGAVLITTKRAKGNGRFNASFSTSLIFDQVNRLPQQQTSYAQGLGGNYIDPQSGSPSSWGPLIDTLRYANDPAYSYSAAGRIVGQNHPLATDRRVVPFDNMNNFFETGLSSNSQLTISGGQENANFLVSVGHHDQTGIIPISDFRRTNVRLYGQIKPLKRLEISGSASFTRSGGNRQQRGSNLSGVSLSLFRAPVSFDLANGVSDPVNDPAAWSFADGRQRNYNAAYDNPYWSVNKNRVRDLVNRMLGVVEAKYRFTDNFYALYRIGLDSYFEERKSYWDGQSGEFRAINGLIIDDLYSFSGLTSDFLLNYDRRLGKDWSFRATAGHSYYAERGYNAIQEGENFVIPGFYDISNTQALIIDDNLNRRKLVGVFYEVEMGWKNFLYLTTTGRNDWSSTLPRNNNSFFYPSASLGIVFTEPLGWSSSRILPFGKLRLSYGEVGNDAPGAYLTGLFYQSVAQVQGRTAFLRSASIGNEDLEPEKSRSYEFGAELRFFRNRIGIDGAVYRNESLGQIISAPVAGSSGFSSIVTNVGKVENKGLEFVIDANPVHKKMLNWDIALNFSRNRNIVIDIGAGADLIRLPGFGLTSTQNVIIPGQPYGVIYGTRWLRDEGGNVLIDDNGYPVMDLQTGVVGDPNPDWLMGLRNTLQSGPFSLSFLFDVRKGGDIFNGTAGVMRSLGIHIDTETREETVVIEGLRQSDGQPNTVPVRKNQNFYSRYPFAGVSEAAIEDGSFLRLRELNLRFDFPERWTRKMRSAGASLTLTGRNLWLLTNYSGIDPETNLSGASNSFGRDYFNAPNTRSFGASLEVSF
jgi:TonB-linked SusC/RagA family outer membrane protein